MWAEAAKWLGKYPEAVLTALDPDGYPASIRVDASGYDAVTGELRVEVPAALRVVEGPAGLMCHHHNEKMWNISAIHIKGRLESRDGAAVFASTFFAAPSKLALVAFIKSARASARKYLDRRGLEPPQVNWAAIKEVQQRVKDF